MADYAPAFSIITPVYRTPLEYLEACIASVEAQTFEDWELILVDNGNARDTGGWLERRAASDPRIRLAFTAQNLGIIGGSQLGLSAASGEFVALLDSDDTLSPVALSRMAEAIAVNPSADYLYSDEDKIVGPGVWGFAFPFFKPDWSPERFRHHMYTCHLSVLRTRLVHQVGGFRDGFEGSQDYDLVLRVTEKARSIVHVPEILYHWRAHPDSTALQSGQKPYAHTAAKRAIQDHCERTGIDAEVDDGLHPGIYRVRRRITGEPRVSLLIPTGKSAVVRGQFGPLVLHLVESIEETTTYRNFEYVICYDSAMDPAVLREVERTCTRPLQLVEYTEPFNFSKKVNAAASRSHGGYLILLNDDLEVITPKWVEELIGHLQDPTVGAVGGLYYFEDDTIQHAGVTCAAGPNHLFYGLPRGARVFGSHLHVARECSVLTGACLAVRRKEFFDVGGFTELLPNSYNDVDFCLKLRSQGFRNIWTPYVEMYHFESKSREGKVSTFEDEWLARRWGPRLYTDPCYNPNLKPGLTTWEPFDDWDAVARGWPMRPRDAAGLDVQGYLELNSDLAQEIARDPSWDPLTHFITLGRYERRLQFTTHERHGYDRNQHMRLVLAAPEAFSREGYLLANPDLYEVALRDGSWDAYQHLVTHGIRERRSMFVPSNGGFASQTLPRGSCTMNLDEGGSVSRGTIIRPSPWAIGETDPLG